MLACTADSVSVGGSVGPVGGLVGGVVTAGGVGVAHVEALRAVDRGVEEDDVAVLDGDVVDARLDGDVGLVAVRR